MRYVGQAYELSVPAAGDFVELFHREHARRYGYSDARRPVEIVNVRARFIGASPRVNWTRQRLGKGDCRAAIIETRAVYFHGRRRVAHVYQREKLRPGNRFRGPAIVAEYSATTVVPGGWSASVDGFENLLLIGEAD
jgi:N-methylhydantoinase A